MLIVPLDDTILVREIASFQSCYLTPRIHFFKSLNEFLDTPISLCQSLGKREGGAGVRGGMGCNQANDGQGK